MHMKNFLHPFVLAGLLMLVLLTPPRISVAQQATSPALDTAERERIEKIVREYLLANPNLILEVMRKLEQRQLAARESAFRDNLNEVRANLFEDANSPVIGNPRGSTVIVEFSDYNCPYCKRMAPIVKRAIEKNKELKVILKEFPILGATSQYAAATALAAREQGKYAEVHFALIGFKGRLSNADIDRIALDAGLDMDKLKADMKMPQIKAAIDNNLNVAERLGIRGTPAFIAGDQLAPGAVSEDAFAALVEQAAASAK